MLEMVHLLDKFGFKKTVIVGMKGKKNCLFCIFCILCFVFVNFFNLKKPLEWGNYCGLFMLIEDTLICNGKGYFNNYYYFHLLRMIGM